MQRLIEQQSSIYDALWMMQADDVDWCKGNEKAILEALSDSIANADKDTWRKFFIGGRGLANPPKGFPQKTGYYIGYRIIEDAIAQSRLQDLVCLNPEDIITMSGISLTW